MATTLKFDTRRAAGAIELIVTAEEDKTYKVLMAIGKWLIGLGVWVMGIRVKYVRVNSEMEGLRERCGRLENTLGRAYRRLRFRGLVKKSVVIRDIIELLGPEVEADYLKRLEKGE
jgi:hypothetical protein